MQYWPWVAVDELWHYGRRNKFDAVDGDEWDLTDARYDMRATAVAVVITGAGRLLGILRAGGTRRIRVASCGESGIHDQNVGRRDHQKHESSNSHDLLPQHHYLYLPTDKVSKSLRAPDRQA